MVGTGLIAAAALFGPPLEPASGPASRCEVELAVLEAGTRRPLAAVDVWADEQSAGTTDEEGRVEVVVDCDAELRLREAGYERWSTVARDAPARVFLMPASGRYRTQVLERRDAEPVSVGTEVIDVERLKTLPGAQGDPLRALQSSPSHGRTPGGAGLIVLHGLAPPATQAFVAGHPVPRAFHSFGLAGVVAAEQITAIGVYPSGFSGRYGGATGGLVVVETSHAIPDRVTGDVSLSLTGAQGGVVVPIKERTAIEVRGRAGIFGPVLAIIDAAAPGNGLVRPEAYSYWSRMTHRRGPATLEGRVWGAVDRVRLGTALELLAGFHRFDLEYRHRSHNWEFLVTPSFRLDHSSYEVGSGTRSSLGQVGSLRAEMKTGESVGEASWSLTIGTSSVVERFSVRSEFVGGPSETDVGVVYRSSAYALSEFHVGSLALAPELRATGLGTQNRRYFVPEPRLRIRWDPTPHVWLGGRVGRYAQPTRVRQSFEAGLIPNTVEFEGRQVLIPPTLIGFFDPQVAASTDDSRVALRTATQGSAEVGVHHSGVTGSVAPFVRYASTQEPDDSSSASHEQLSFGAEFRIGLETERLSLLAGYTALRSLRRRGGAYTPAAFDQPHSLVLLGQVRFGRGWMLGARFRLTSGLPYAAVIGSVQGDLGSFSPLFEDSRGARSPIFHQLDLRLDKRWILDRAIVSGFIDVMNVYNNVYPELRTYRLDFSEQGQGLGLPIVPTVGMSVEF